MAEYPLLRVHDQMGILWCFHVHHVLSVTDHVDHLPMMVDVHHHTHGRMDVLWCLHAHHVGNVIDHVDHLPMMVVALDCAY